MEELLTTICLAAIFLIQSAQAFKLSPVGGAAETNRVDNGAGDLFFDREQIVPESVTAQVGGRLVLSCEAGGSPTPTIHWLFNNERIPQSDNTHIEDDEAVFENNAHNNQMPTLKIGSTKSRLFIDCITEAQRGDYTCVADEPTRRIAKITRVKVVSSFNGDDILLSSCLDKRQPEVSSPARVYMWTAHRLEIEGADVQLFCRAAGVPAPTISWVMVTKTGDEVPLTSDQYQVLENGDLFLHEISFLGNMGTYRCIAENTHGKDEADAFLYPTALGK